MSEPVDQPVEQPTEQPTEQPRASRRWLVVGVIAGASLLTAMILAFASREEPDPPDAELSIDSPAIVTGLSFVAPAATGSFPTTPDIVIDSVDVPATPITRELLGAGSFTCLDPGLWQPYPELQLVVQVGEPAIGEVCPDTVVPLPIGHCSTAPCSRVPDNWEIRTVPGLPETAMLAVVAPDSPQTAWFLCYVDLTPHGPQYLPLATGTDAACRAATENSVDIPYVPPPTNDIPFVPPSLSSDIPGG